MVFGIRFSMFYRISIAQFSVIALLSCLSVHAELPLWKQKSNAASGLESRGEHGKAVALYQEALKLISQNDLNTKAKLEASLASNLLAVGQYDRAVDMGIDAAKIAKELKSANKLDPDVLLSLNYLQENCGRYRETKEYKARTHELDNKVMALSLMLRQAVNPRDPFIFHDHLTYARTFISLHRDPEAEKELLKLKQWVKPNTRNQTTVLLCLDAMRMKRGQPGKFEAEYLAKTKPESAALRKVAECKFWAGDHKGSIACLEKAKLKIRGTASEKLEETVDINRQFASIKMDFTDWKGAEVYLRQSVALLSKDPQNYKQLQTARGLLAHCLKQQNRVAEADALLRESKRKQPNGKYRYDFIFTDEERTALEKERAGKSSAPR